MSKISLSAGFSVIPEGSYVFKIVKTEFKEKFGKIKVFVETSDGQKLTESYDLNNNGGLNAFSFMAKCALHDMSLDEIDHEQLVGCFFTGDVEHDVLPKKDDPTKTVTFANIRNRGEATDEEEQTFIAESKNATKTTSNTAAPKGEKAKVKPDLSFLDN